MRFAYGTISSLVTFAAALLLTGCGAATDSPATDSPATDPVQGDEEPTTPQALALVHAEYAETPSSATREDNSWFAPESIAAQLR